jgi:DNA-directed RNA polymerase specialized sigma24 family protein
MQADEFFATRWPELVPELRQVLARAGTPTADRADVVQETAVRLLGMWDRIDWDRPIAPLARRIALNAWRDQWRRRGAREIVGPVPEQSAASDTERAALARVHVGEVARALAAMPPATARVLRVAAAEAEVTSMPAAPSAVRMARSRARRALAATLRIASAVAAVVAAGSRAAGRSARTSTAAAGVLATMAFVLGGGAATTHAASSPTVRQPIMAVGAVVTHVPASRPATVTRTALSKTGVGAHRTRTSHPKTPKAPYYYVGTDAARVGVFMDVGVQGYGVRVAKPEPGTTTPVCTTGDTPTVTPVPRCAS